MNGERLNSFRQTLNDFLSANTPNLRPICAEANINSNSNTNQAKIFAAHSRIYSAFDQHLTSYRCLITQIIWY